MEFNGERCVPWSEEMKRWDWVLDHHLKRYIWARPYCTGQDVVDLGCGAGYGTHMLSFNSRRALGLDISDEAIKFANRWFRAPNINFLTCDVVNDFIPLWLDTMANTVVCFEMLEHVDDPAFVLKRMKDIAPVGVLLGSMPVNDSGRFHKRAYSAEQIKELVSSFGKAAFYYQDDTGEILHYSVSTQRPKYVLFHLPLRS